MRSLGALDGPLTGLGRDTHGDVASVPSRAHDRILVAISGPLCSGKTTLATQLVGCLSGALLVPEFASSLRHRIPAFNWGDTAERGYLRWAQHLAEVEPTSDLVLLDGSLSDVAAHDYAYGVDLPLLVQPHRYRLTLLCDPTDIPLAANGIRDPDAVLRSRVFDRLRHEVFARSDQVTLLTGTIEERLETALSKISAVSPLRSATNLAGVVIATSDGSIGLIRRKSTGRWEIPGGKVETGETVVAAASRELAEELGLTCHSLLPLGSASFAEDGTSYQYTYLLGFADPADAVLREPHKFSEFRFVSIREIDSGRVSISPGVRRLLQMRAAS